MADLPAEHVLVNHMIVLHQQAADRDRHPAVLVAMIVNGTGLSNLPANRDQLIKRVLIDQIAGVMLAIPREIGRQRIRVERIPPEICGLLRGPKCCFGKLRRSGYEIANRNLFPSRQPWLGDKV